MTASVEFEWHWDLKFTLLVFAVLPLTISAGFWQLDRADQKRTALAQLDLGLSQAPVSLTALGDEAANYRRVELVGEWLEPLFLLDNRTRSGRVGYEVVGLFSDQSGEKLLVNRGWLPAGNDRSVLPQIDRPVGNQPVAGYLYRAAQKPIVFAEQQWSGEWPELTQVIDFELLTARTSETLYPFVLRIDPESPLAYQADWAIKRDGPSMHLGYAFQWFAMSLTVLILFVFANSNLWRWWKSRQQN